MKHISRTIGIAMWVAGWILAKGFWWTLLAVLVPLYGWYLVIKTLLVAGGLV